MKVFGSVADLEKASGEKVTDLHKHIVDKITFKCEKCAGIMQRVPDVLDTWFDSGSMPYAQMHYPFENKEKFEANFPAKFIAEGVDQTRAWFYYLHVLSNAIKERPAFKNVIVNGIVLAEDGKKMSKRLNNYPDPSLIFDKYGADAMRYYLLSSPVMMADNFNFAEGGVVEALRKNNMVLWNVYKFYEIYAVETQDFASLRTSDNVLDKWILFKLEQLIFEVTDKMNDYDLPRSVRPITDFINDLSTWYIRRSRDRFKGESTPSPLEGEGRGEVGGDKEAALATTKYVLTELAKVMAPFMPFIAEQLWQKVTGNDFKDENKSVHLEEWPKMQLTITNDELKNNEDMELARKLVERILAFRDEKGIKVRQPLQSVNIRKHSTEWTPDDQIRKIVLEEVNIKEWKFFGDDVKSSDNYWAEYSFKNSDEEKYSFQLAIDFSLSEELILEGTKRELVRSINNLRKNANMSIQDRAIIYWQAESEMVAKVFAEMAKELKKDTLSNEIKNEKSEGVDIVKEVKVNDEMVWLGIKKV
ncbi:MAG: Isoleucine-tRNA ligase [Parcubacteria group bacterium GW2011_GWE2_39_37]|nr:MAG: Isoleucine-tRNA ligase [Parcubacteria group bacterium GW2011_GWE2_39_37]